METDVAAAWMFDTFVVLLTQKTNSSRNNMEESAMKTMRMKEFKDHKAR